MSVGNSEETVIVSGHKQWMFLFSLIAQTVSFPQWPPRYTIRGTWKVPYTNLSNPITIVREPGRQYTDQLNGLERIWNSGPEERIHRKIVGAGDKMVCFTIPDDEPFDIEFTEFLPSPEGFSLQQGDYSYHGKLCDLWVKKIDGGKTQTYKMYIDKAGNPVAYVLQAVSMFHSHYDVYILEIDEFINDILPGYWNIPTMCKDAKPDPYPGNQFNLFFPSPKNDNTLKNLKAQKSAGKNVSSRFIHMDPSSFRKTIQMKRENRARRLLGQNDVEYCQTYYGTPQFPLPAEFSWRNATNVVGKPRDQVACGSCWAFSTAEAVESQFAIKTGKFREISTNQIMDCTWDTNNNGCSGGEVAPALYSLMKNKIPIAYESEYPYLGASGYCNKNIQDVAGYIAGCYQIDKKSDTIKEALIKFGPLAIAINVISEMSFYNGGVIDNQKCTGTPEDLVHAVLLTGWKVIDGKEAWEIKNSWSTYWGYEGYIYIQSEHQEWNCGVTTDAVAPIVALAPNN